MACQFLTLLYDNWCRFLRLLCSVRKLERDSPYGAQLHEMSSELGFPPAGSQHTSTQQLWPCYFLALKTDSTILPSTSFGHIGGLAFSWYTLFWVGFGVLSVPS